MLTEEHLLHLLQGAKSPRTLGDVKKLIFEGEAVDFRVYNCVDINDLDETVLEVVQDA